MSFIVWNAERQGATEHELPHYEYVQHSFLNVYFLKVEIFIEYKVLELSISMLPRV